MKCTGRQIDRRMSRRGMTLIEIVVVISILGALMSLGVVLLGLMLRADNAGSEALATQLSVSRLERQFRADAHDADAVAADDDAQRLELRQSDGRHIDWSISEAGIARQASDGASITMRDEYRLPDGETRFTVGSSGRLVELRHRYGLATLTETPADDTVAPAHEWLIQAAVGIAVGGTAESATDDKGTEP